VDFELSRFSPQYIYDGRFRRGAKTKAVVLARAIEVASTEGLEGLTIGRLATDLGMSNGHLSVLFPSKEALQIATLDAAMARFADEVVARAERVRSSRTRVGGLCDAWFRYVARRVFPVAASSSRRRTSIARGRERSVTACESIGRRGTAASPTRSATGNGPAESAGGSTWRISSSSSPRIRPARISPRSSATAPRFAGQRARRGFASGSWRTPGRRQPSLFVDADSRLRGQRKPDLLDPPARPEPPARLGFVTACAFAPRGGSG
jgi:AcrR family transcriptional regulator